MSRRAHLKALGTGALLLRRPERILPPASSASPHDRPAFTTIDRYEVTPAGGALEREPDPLEMLNRINRLHGEFGTAPVEVDGVTTYAEVFPLGDHNVEVISEIYPEADGSSYQIGRVAYIPDGEGELSDIEFNFDSTGSVWLESSDTLLPVEVDMANPKRRIRYREAVLHWYDIADGFSPSEVWAGVEEGIALRNDPEAAMASTFVADRIEPTVHYDLLQGINAEFISTDLEADELDEFELAEAEAAYANDDFVQWNVDDLAERLTTLRQKGSIWTGISRAHLIQGGIGMIREAFRIVQGGEYQGLPQDVQSIFDGIPDDNRFQVGEVAELLVLGRGEEPEDADEFLPPSSGFAFYDLDK